MYCHTALLHFLISNLMLVIFRQICSVRLSDNLENVERLVIFKSLIMQQQQLLLTVDFSQVKILFKTETNNWPFF